MCYYPRVITNPKYKANKKNGGIIPPISDVRVTQVPIKCGNCQECRKQKAREWQIRLMEDIRRNTNAKFVTLTFSDKSIYELVKQEPTKNWPSMKGLKGYELDNEIATRAVRLFLERWRKKHKTSLRHWLVTELGHEGTENIHLHGIVWTNESLEEVEQHWKYGWVWKGKEENDKLVNYVNNQTINYIVKYVSKQDAKHKGYRSKMLTSAGIGRGYEKTLNGHNNKYKPGQTKEYYKTTRGDKINMPIYWRNKIYSEEEREKLWIEKLDKEVRYVGGEKVDISQGEENYYKLLEWYRNISKELGYGTGERDWIQEEYEKERRIINQNKRIAKGKKEAENK